MVARGGVDFQVIREQLLEEESSRQDKYLENSEELLGDPIPVPVQVQVLTEQLQKIKFELNSLRSKEYFLKKVLSDVSENESVQSLFPTSQQLAEMDVSIGQAKTELRKAKAARREAEKRLPEVAAEFATSSESCAIAKAGLEEYVDVAVAAEQLRQVSDMLASDDGRLLEEFTSDIPKLHAVAAEEMLKGLEKLQESVHTEYESVKQKNTTLDSAIAEINDERKKLEAECKSMQDGIRRNERANAESQVLRQALVQEEKISEILRSLTGAEVQSVDEKSIALKLYPHVFGVKGRPADEEVEKENGQTLKVSVPNGLNSRAVSASFGRGSRKSAKASEKVKLAVDRDSVPVVLHKAIDALIEQGI